MKNKDLRQIKSQLKLKNAYLSLLAQGYEQLSIQQICKEAAVTRPTFYKQFQDIQQLRLVLNQSLITDLKSALTIRNPKPLADTERHEMSDNVIRLFEHIEENSIAYETLLIVQPDALFINDVKHVIKEFIQEGTYHSQEQSKLIDVNFDFILSFYSGAYIESIIWWIQNSFQPSAKETATIVVETAFYGSFKDPVYFNYEQKK